MNSQSFSIRSEVRAAIGTVGANRLDHLASPIDPRQLQRLTLRSRRVQEEGSTQRSRADECWRFHRNSDVESRQQFSGHKEMTFRPGSAILRNRPDREPSLARLTSSVIGLPTAFSKSAFVVSRLLKKLGGGPSAFQTSMVPLSRLASTSRPMCGFLKSTLVSVPDSVTRSFRSNMAVML